jgi:hypothetical protein
MMYRPKHPATQCVMLGLDLLVRVIEPESGMVLDAEAARGRGAGTTVELRSNVVLFPRRGVENCD